MASVNEMLQDDFVSHTVDLLRLSANLRNKSVAFLKILEEDLVAKLMSASEGTFTKTKLMAVLAACRVAIRSAYGEIDADHTTSMIRLAAVERDFLQSTTEAVIGVGLPYAGLTEEQIKTIVSGTLINGAPSSEWWSQQSTQLQNRFSNEIRLGFSQGESIDDMVRRIRGTWTGRRTAYEVGGKTRWFYEFAGGLMDVTTRQAEALVRTSVQTISNEVRNKIYRGNSDVISSLKWVATLDMRTTPLCRARDGLLYTIDGEPIGHDQAFLGGPPAHWNCRSTLVPVTKSFDEILGIPGLEDAYKEVFNANATRASMDGQVPETKTFDDWFNSQSEDRQKEMLGPRRWEIWNNRGLTQQQLVDQMGNQLTIEELEQKYGKK